MKRIAPLIFTIALCAGMLMPLSAIFSSNSIQIQTNVAQAADENKTDTKYVAPVNFGQYIHECSLTGSIFGSEKGNLTGCVEQFIYIIPYTLGSWLMTQAAIAFDAAASLTISSTLYTANGSSFLQKGWSITRDFANIFFILILLVVALSLVLDMDIGGANPKKMISSVIIVAILINFSFFMTEVVIDISNSLALVFYNQISSVSQDGKPIDNSNQDDQFKTAKAKDGTTYITKVKPLSLSLVSSFKPQIFNSPDFYTKLSCAGSGGFFTFTNKTCPEKKDIRLEPSVSIPIMLIIGVMFMVVAYSFAIALISFIGRMINLFIAIIFAPFAFVSTILPAAKGIPGFGWDEWFKGLIKSAFAAPIYFFLLLLITFLVQIPIVPVDAKDLAISPGILLTLVLIQFGIVVTLIMKATSYVEGAAGDIGSMVLKGTKVLLGGAAGLAAGTALGGAALLGQGSLGWLGKKIAGADRMNRWAMGESDGKMFGRKIWGLKGIQQALGEKSVKTGQFLGKSSFDARHTGLGNMVTSATGISLGSFGSMASDKTVGGLDGAVARKAAKEEKFANSLKYNQKAEGEIKDGKKAKEDAIAKQQVLADTAEEVFKDAKDAIAEVLAPLEADLAAKKAAYQAILDEEVNQFDTVAIDDKNRRLKDAGAEINGGVLSSGATVKGAQVALSEEKEFMNKTALLQAEDEYKAEKKKLKDLQEGEKDPVTGKQRGVKIGDHRLDGSVISNATEVAEMVAKQVKSIETLGIKDFDDLLESNKKAAAKTYLSYLAQQSGYHTHIDRDKLGNVKDFHVDTSQKGGSHNVVRAFRNVAIAGIVGGLAGPIAGLSAISTAGYATLASVFREGLAGLASVAENGQFTVGARYSAAEAAHHANEGGKHDHEHGVYTPNKGFFKELLSIFKVKASGGGGGGGGGGHAPAAHH